MQDSQAKREEYKEWTDKDTRQADRHTSKQEGKQTGTYKQKD